MIHLVLDTNIIRGEGINSSWMQVLKQHTDSGAIQVYVPEIVKRELLTNKVGEYQKEIKKCISSINNSLRKKLLNESEIKSLTESRSYLDTALASVEERVESEYKQWASNLGVKTLFFNNDNMKHVMNDYFSGGGVFKKIKSREDIPDAMINTSINDLLEKNGTVTVINSDKEFTEFISKNEFITCHKTLSDFLASDPVEAIKVKVELTQELTEYFSTPEYIEQLTAYLTSPSDRIDKVEDVYIDKEGIEGTEKIAEWLLVAEINFIFPHMIYNVAIENINSASLYEYIGNIEFTAKVGISYGTHYGIYHSMDKNREVEFYSADEEIVELIEEFEVKFFGQITIDIDQDDNHPINSKEDLLANDDSICVNLDIEAASILS